MAEGSFGTTITCMDGRVQEPVSTWMKRQFGVDYVDTITEAGPDGILADGPLDTVASIKKRAGISVNGHGSRVIVVVGHHDCAGNPGAKAKHLGHLEQAVKRVASWKLRKGDRQLCGMWIGACVPDPYGSRFRAKALPSCAKKYPVPFPRPARPPSGTGTGCFSGMQPHGRLVRGISAFGATWTQRGDQEKMPVPIPRTFPRAGACRTDAPAGQPRGERCCVENPERGQATFPLPSHARLREGSVREEAGPGARWRTEK